MHGTAWYCLLLTCVAFMVMHLMARLHDADGIALYGTVLHDADGIALYGTVLHGKTVYCMVLHGIA